MGYEKEKQPQAQEVFVFLHCANGQLSRHAELLPPHCSPAYDLILVIDGSCKLFLNDSQTLLIPGDLLLARAGQRHRLLPSVNSKAYQCFFPEEPFKQELQRLCGLYTQPVVYQRPGVQHRVRSLHLFNTSSSDVTALHSDTPAGLQYMTHLERAELDCIEGLLQHILKEQQNQLAGSKQMRLAYFQQLLILLRRIQLQQFETNQAPQSWKQELVERVLEEIDLHIAENIDLEEIARQQGITVTYLRSIFKSIVGSPPLDYLNRARIMASLELLQTSDLPIAEIAARVGISDANYFSRLFKKVIGYPPRYFKSIPPVNGK